MAGQVIQNVKAIDPNTISYDLVTPQVVQSLTYDITVLTRTRDAMQADLNAQTAAQQANIDLLTNLIAQANQLGVVAQANPQP